MKVLPSRAYQVISTSSGGELSTITPTTYFLTTLSIVGNLLYQLDEKVLATQVMIHDLVCESQYVLLLGNSLSVYKEAIPNGQPCLRLRFHLLI